MIWKLENMIKSYTVRNHGYLIGKPNQKPVILTFGQFDHLIILDKLIWTCPTWLTIFLTNHKMVFLTSQIKQNFGQPKNNN
jgi:hypothetical protein